MASKKKLTHDDRILWGKVARSVRALPGRLDEIEMFEQELEALTAIDEAKDKAREKPDKKKDAGKTAPQAAPAPSKERQHQPLERPVKRKIARGRLPLEARIDLHGMIQSEAHAMLHDFLVRAHERGLRHVLVITGKGTSMGSEGALKRAVPMWFANAEFKFLISSYEPAAANHGGDGALYVRLARQNGDPG